VATFDSSPTVLYPGGSDLTASENLPSLADPLRGESEGGMKDKEKEGEEGKEKEKEGGSGKTPLRLPEANSGGGSGLPSTTPRSSFGVNRTKSARGVSVGLTPRSFNSGVHSTHGSSTNLGTTSALNSPGFQLSPLSSTLTAASPSTFPTPKEIFSAAYPMHARISASPSKAYIIIFWKDHFKFQLVRVSDWVCQGSKEEEEVEGWKEGEGEREIEEEESKAEGCGRRKGKEGEGRGTEGKGRTLLTTHRQYLPREMREAWPGVTIKIISWSYIPR
jgi:hypothetical protein